MNIWLIFLFAGIGTYLIRISKGQIVQTYRFVISK